MEGKSNTFSWPCSLDAARRTLSFEARHTRQYPNVTNGVFQAHKKGSLGMKYRVICGFAQKTSVVAMTPRVY
jgi:hypothetical protein